MELYFDLDGTLIDISYRYYTIHSELIKKFGGMPISKTVYWTMKRNKVSLQEILEKSLVSNTFRENYQEDFLKKIESPEYLALDKLFPYTLTVLSSLQRMGNQLYLVSYRKNIDGALQELGNFKILDKFIKIKIGKTYNKGHRTKIEFIEAISTKKKKLIVGDTEDDVLAAKLSGFPSVAVLSGIRSKSQLVEYEPDYIIKDIRNLAVIVNKYQYKTDR